MQLVVTAFLTLVGLVIGSFLSAYTYRSPRGVSISQGRSKCPRCKKLIPWYDNFPVVSYLLLRGKSRCCKKSISVRYPILEITTALSFVTLNYFVTTCTESIVCRSSSALGVFTIPLFLIVLVVVIAIFVIDLEHQIIPDELVFALLVIAFGISIVRHDELFLNLFAGFAAAVFLLLLHLGTRGNGMGLGDVKLVIPLGIILGWPGTFLFLTASFVLGAVVGVSLIALGKAHFGRHIPFGPFLVLGFLLVLFLPSNFYNDLIVLVP